LEIIVVHWLDSPRPSRPSARKCDRSSIARETKIYWDYEFNLANKLVLMSNRRMREGGKLAVERANAPANASLKTSILRNWTCGAISGVQS
ncbi:Protein of unknown function, partial [Cotesia congregata]